MKIKTYLIIKLMIKTLIKLLKMNNMKIKKYNKYKIKLIKMKGFLLANNKYQHL